MDNIGLIQLNQNDRLGWQLGFKQTFIQFGTVEIGNDYFIFLVEIIAGIHLIGCNHFPSNCFGVETTQIETNFLALVQIEVTQGDAYHTIFFRCRSRNGID